MPAAKERTHDVFPLAAVLRLLPENRVRGFGIEKQTFIGSPTWLSSTSRWGCGYRCDGTASDSSVGRFNTADPSTSNVQYSNPASVNIYSYVNEDPVNFNDPKGLKAEDCFPDDSACSSTSFDDFGGDNNWDYARPWSLWSPDTWIQDPTGGGFLSNGFGQLAVPVGPIRMGAATACIANPILCITITAGSPEIMIGAGILIGASAVWVIMSKTTSKDLAPPYATTQGPDARGRDGNGNCTPPDPSQYAKWRGSDSLHWHYIDWNQNPVTCVAYPIFQTGSDLGPRYREISR